MVLTTVAVGQMVPVVPQAPDQKTLAAGMSGMRAQAQMTHRLVTRNHPTSLKARILPIFRLCNAMGRLLRLAVQTIQTASLVLSIVIHSVVVAMATIARTATYSMNRSSGNAAMNGKKSRERSVVVCGAM
jgi:hypothetical protein